VYIRRGGKRRGKETTQNQLQRPTCGCSARSLPRSAAQIIPLARLHSVRSCLEVRIVKESERKRVNRAREYPEHRYRTRKRSEGWDSCLTVLHVFGRQQKTPRSRFFRVSIGGYSAVPFAYLTREAARHLLAGGSRLPFDPKIAPRSRYQGPRAKIRVT